MLLNKYKKREKDALATQRELNALREDRWTGRWVPCEPFHYGWIRDYVLRPDIAARADAKIFRDIIARIGGSQWSKENDFTVPKSWHGKLRRIRVPMCGPGLSTIEVRPDVATGTEQGWPFPESYKKWFYRHSGIDHGRCGCYSPFKWFVPDHYIFKTPWMFEYRIRPAFISKMPAADGTRESRLSVLNRHMESKQYWRLLQNIRGQYHRGSDDRSWFMKKQLVKEFREELESPYE